jgi:16S rRNA (guanine1516-N2)-methyltransferase
MTTIAVYTSYPDLLVQAEALASHLHLPFSQKADFLLSLTPDFLGLQLTSQKSAPLYIDFVTGKLNYRRQHLSLRREALARALGLKTTKPPYIIDATAGLARDSFIIAALGFNVTLIERSGIIAALIEDGLQRAMLHPEVAPIARRMHLIQDNAITYIEQLVKKPDVIYLDPMFPSKKKSALSKQDMRIFHEVVGEDLDGNELLKTALACASQRVVVKRPRLAKPLAGIDPSYILEGSSSRFDIYLI